MNLVCYKVTLYKDFHPYTGVDLPVIENEYVHGNYVYVRPGGSYRWNMSEMKRAQWQATKLIRCVLDTIEMNLSKSIKQHNSWKVVDKDISSERRFLHEGTDGLTYYLIYLVKNEYEDRFAV